MYAWTQNNDIKPIEDTEVDEESATGDSLFSEAECSSSSLIDLDQPMSELRFPPTVARNASTSRD